MFHDPMAVKLGRKPVKRDPRTLKLSNYLPKLPAVPQTQNWGAKVSAWGMMKNDTVGDCTCAAAGHIVLLDTAARGAPVVIPDDDIIGAYEKIAGYIPGDESTDNGASEIDVLNYFRKTGIGGHKILAYATINLRDTAMVRQAIYLFGSVYAGVLLPISAQAQGIWKLDGVPVGNSAPGSWGGHAVPLIAYDQENFACVTWGDVKWLTEGWWQTYADEAYALISEDWSPPAGVAPNSFNLDQLKADLAEITKEN